MAKTRRFLSVGGGSRNNRRSQQRKKEGKQQEASRKRKNQMKRQAAANAAKASYANTNNPTAPQKEVQNKLPNTIQKQRNASRNSIPTTTPLSKNSYLANTTTTNTNEPTAPQSDELSQTNQDPVATNLSENVRANEPQTQPITKKPSALNLLRKKASAVGKAALAARRWSGSLAEDEEHTYSYADVEGYPGWEVVTLEQNPVVKFYINMSENKRQWHHPGSEGLPSNTFVEETNASLPEGWTRFYFAANKNRKTPWYEFIKNNGTNITQWKKPTAPQSDELSQTNQDPVATNLSENVRANEPQPQPITKKPSALNLLRKKASAVGKAAFAARRWSGSLAQDAEHTYIYADVEGYPGWEVVTLEQNPVVKFYVNKTENKSQWHHPGSEGLPSNTFVEEANASLPEGWTRVYFAANKNRKTPWYEFIKNDGTNISQWKKPMSAANAAVAPEQTQPNATSNTAAPTPGLTQPSAQSSAPADNNPFNNVMAQIAAVQKTVQQLENTIAQSPKQGGRRKTRKARRSAYRKACRSRKASRSAYRKAYRKN